MSTFETRTKSDSFYLEVFSLVYEVMVSDFISGPIVGTDAGGIDFKKTKQYINQGKDTDGGELQSLYFQIEIKLGNNPNLLEEDFKTRNDRIYFGWIYDQYPSIIKNYLFQFLRQSDYPTDQLKKEKPPTTPLVTYPIYILRSTNPANGQGANGYIRFADNDDKGIIALGSIDYNSYNIGLTDCMLSKNTDNIIKPFEFKDVILSSEDMNFRSLADDIIITLESQLDEYLSGKYSGTVKFFIVEGKNPETPPNNIYPYIFKGKIQSNSTGKGLKETYIEDDLNTQGLPGSSCYSDENGLFNLFGQYIASAPNPGEIFETIKYKVKSGDTLSKIALKYPQKGLDGKDIPFYPERTMQIYKANPILDGRGISLKDAANENQVLENENLIFTDETISIPFYKYKSKPNTFNITFSKENYITKTIIPLDGDNNILPYQKINLEPTEPSKKETIKQAPLEDSQVKIVTVAKQLEAPSTAMIDTLLQDMLKNLKITLIPAIMSLFKSFGITNIEDLLLKGIANATFSCPANLNELEIVVERLGKLAKDLQNNYDKLDKIKGTVEDVNIAISIADGVFAALSAVVLAFPSVPFAPDVTKFMSTPLPGLNKSTQKIISDTLGTLSFLSGSTLMVLTIITSVIQTILNYLSLLDQLVQQCASKMGNVELVQNRISLVQQLSTLQQSDQGSPKINNYKGFEIEVNTVLGSENNGLSKRQAIAKNADGVIMLRGEPSFSSNDQILIDQLTFFIEQNNLKSGASNETIINP